MTDQHADDVVEGHDGTHGPCRICGVGPDGELLADAVRLCPNGQPNPNYRCRFCHIWLHSFTLDCGCSERREQTLYACLCHGCAEALDFLAADTPVGRVHRELVHQANMAGRPSSDDW